jgi:hypothetical protein
MSAMWWKLQYANGRFGAFVMSTMGTVLSFDQAGAERQDSE